MSDDEDGSEPRSLVDRAFRVIGTFHEGRVWQSLSEISRNAGLNVATTHRILGRLVAWGALERGADGRYCVGLRLWEVASLSPRAMSLERVSRPYIHGLYEVTRCSIHLAVRDHDEAVFIDRLHNPEQRNLRTRVGGRYPLNATSVGLVLLAYATEDVIDDLLARPLPAYTELTCTDPVELQRMLAEVRRKGVAVADRTMNPEVRSVAAPIEGPDGTVVAALSINASQYEKDLSAEHIVRITANSISRALSGATPAMRTRRALRSA